LAVAEDLSTRPLIVVKLRLFTRKMQYDVPEVAEELVCWEPTHQHNARGVKNSGSGSKLVASGRSTQLDPESAAAISCSRAALA